ncbi:MAG: hypothetical protein PHU85_09100 [Phycisphaerae bacterium]|nr:hypothetical protein [Phycisphaerae bacterium]
MSKSKPRATKSQQPEAAPVTTPDRPACTFTVGEVGPTPPIGSPPATPATPAAPPPALATADASPPATEPAPAKVLPDPAAVAAESERWRLAREKAIDNYRENRRMLAESEAARRGFESLNYIALADPTKAGDLLDETTRDYLSGRFFLHELALFYNANPELSLTVFELRQEWIRQYDLRTVPEIMLVDQAVMAYFHVVRFNTEIARLMAVIHGNIYIDQYPELIEKHGGKSAVQLAVADSVREMQDRLAAMLDRFNLMFLRNLDALRRLKSSPVNINIGQAGQVNVGQQQVNLAAGDARP